MEGVAKISQERRNMFSVMANQGFGNIIVIKNGLMIIIPNDCIKVDGQLKTTIRKIIKKNVLTIGDVKILSMRGVVVTTA